MPCRRLDCLRAAVAAVALFVAPLLLGLVPLVVFQVLHLYAVLPVDLLHRVLLEHVALRNGGENGGDDARVAGRDGYVATCNSNYTGIIILGEVPLLLYDLRRYSGQYSLTF